MQHIIHLSPSARRISAPGPSSEHEGSASDDAADERRELQCRSPVERGAGVLVLARRARARGARRGRRGRRRGGEGVAHEGRREARRGTRRERDRGPADGGDLDDGDAVRRDDGGVRLRGRRAEDLRGIFEDGRGGLEHKHGLDGRGRLPEDGRDVRGEVVNQSGRSIHSSSRDEEDSNSFGGEHLFDWDEVRRVWSCK